MLGFWPFSRSVEVKDYLRKTKKIRIKGMTFQIRKLNLEDHLAGLNVILKLHDEYKREKPNAEKAVDDIKSMTKFMRDFIYAGVAVPKLTMVKGPPPEGEIHVDEITADLDLAQALCAAILQYGYGKKN